MKITKNVTEWVVFIGLFLIPFIVFIVPGAMFFPFISGKGFAFRILVEILFAAYVFLAAVAPEYRPKFSWITKAVLGFAVVIFISDLLGANVSKSLWSNYERMEGFVLILHLVLYYIVASSFLKTREKWHQFWNVSILSSFIMSCYGLLQLFSMLAIHQGTDRIDATFGNASYFAIYLVFHIFLCLYFLADPTNPKWQKWMYWGIAIFNTVILYFTATRGAILGLIGGLVFVGLMTVFKEKENKRLRKVGRNVLFGVVALIVLFFAVRNTHYVQTNMVLSRFATLSFSEFKTQGRYFVWPMALKGVADRPVFGWGQENFNFVFNKYYDAHMFGQEEWFDRTHDIFLDWLIAGGIVGFLGYVSMFVALLYYIWRKNSTFTLPEKSIITGMLAAYVFHNMFVFDNLTSYILFFSVLAFVHSRSVADQTSGSSFYTKNISDSIALYMVAPVALVVLVFAVYYVNIPALFANQTLIQSIQPQKEGPQKNLDLFKQVFAYNSFGSSEALEQLVTITSQVVAAQAPDDVKQGFYNLSKQKIEEKIAQTPHDARYLVFAGSFFDHFGQYDLSLPYLTRAIEESPQKQTILFELGTAEVGKGDPAKGLEYFKKAYDLNPVPTEVKIIYLIGGIYAKNQAIISEMSKLVPTDTILNNDRFLQAYAKSGDYNTAFQILNTRIQKNPDVRQNYLYLASLYATIGQNSKAVNVLQTLIDKDPSFKAEGEGYIRQLQGK